MLYVDSVRCTGCGACIESCHVGALSMRDKTAWIDEDLCDQCEACLPVCPAGAIILLQVVDPTMSLSLSSPTGTKLDKKADSDLSLGKSIRGLVKPTLSAALYWAGTELLPHLDSIVSELILYRKQVASPTLASNTRELSTEFKPGGSHRKQRRTRSRRGQ